ncbi:Fic family protein [Lentzea albida]|uniref:Fic family protein n=1 Tax=Lentzea albida TaxID=65499 RepID=A0A1H9NS12_9PSEU|nr:Fic family protein [Lentzea albida]SER38760.1 Fic family protein [Lentzea albida]
MTQRLYRPIPNFTEWNEPDDTIQIERVSYELSNSLSTAAPEAIAAVTRKLGREAAAESGAIEDLYKLGPGHTRTIASEEPGWEDVLTRQSAEALSIFDSQVDAYDFVRQEAQGQVESGEYWIKQLHAHVCRNQKTYKAAILLGDGSIGLVDRPLVPGRYREDASHTIRRDGEKIPFCPITDLLPEMHRLAEQVESPDFQNAHPVTQAAYVHYCLTHIHPFSDGNGRTARAWASLYTYKAYGIPLIVYSDRRGTYLQSLEAANEGGYGDLIRHFQYRTIDTLSRAQQELDSASNSSIEDHLASLLEIKPTDARITLASAQEVAYKIANHISSELHAMAVRLNSAGEGSFSLKIDKPEYQIDTLVVAVTGSLKTPASVTSRIELALHTSGDLTSMYLFNIHARRRTPAAASMFSTVSDMRMTYEDAFPQLATSAIDRIELLIDKILRDLIGDLQRSLRSVLRQGGLSAE